MNDPHGPSPEGYTPGRRTALLLAGTGTAGAYHAGVLRALNESGVRIDVVAGCGAGAIGAVFAAIDLGSSLWDRDGLWRRPEARRSYTWRPAFLAAGLSLLVALASLVVPVLLLLAGLFAYLAAYVAQVTGIPGGEALAGGYSALVSRALAAGALPALLPRIAVVGLAGFAVSALVAAAASRAAGRRAGQSGFLWAMLAAPLHARALAEAIRNRLWRVIAGAPGRRQPSPPEFSRLYAELLAENLGQPGFRELLLSVHDLDARRDLVFAMLAPPFRAGFFRDRSGQPGRLAEAFDLSGVSRQHILDVLLSSLAVPGVTEPGFTRFGAESYWRGETHRLASRPASAGRLLLELERAGVEQVIVASAASRLEEPHTLGGRPADLVGRLGEHLTASDAAAFDDALFSGRARFTRLFPIVPDYNPLGSLDFAGCHDGRSDRRRTLAELLERGYEDAYLQFIEPFVAGEGEQAAGTTLTPG